VTRDVGQIDVDVMDWIDGLIFLDIHQESDGWMGGWMDY
jgi:hypothetical protein